MWGIGLRVDDPRANDPRRWKGNFLLDEARSAVREEIRDSETGLIHPASAGRFRTPTGNAGINEISSAPRSCSLTAASACQRPPSVCSTFFSNTSADESQERLEIAYGVGPGLALSEHGPYLVGGTVALDAVSFTTKLAIHRGGDAIAPYRCVALRDTGSPQTFFRRDVLDLMLLVGTASAACERPCSPRSWGGFGESLQTSTIICLSVQFFRYHEPTCSLAIWACVIPPSVMEHDVMLARDSWMRFNTRSYRALPPRPHDNLFFGQLTLSHHACRLMPSTPWPRTVFSTSSMMTRSGLPCRTSLNCSR